MKLKKYQPFSPLGIACLLITGYLLLFPASEQYDLLASIFGSFLLVALVVLGFVFFLNLRRLPALGTAFIPHSRHLPGIPTKGQLRMPGLKLFPLMRLEVVRKFKQSGIKAVPIKLLGGAQEELKESFTAQHRGFWESNGVLVTLSDALGLYRIERFVEVPLQITAYPRPEPAPQVSISPSVFQAGDLSFPNAPRFGEPFDMKRYDKADGIKRILWRVFARSGELFVRVPEQAIYPESEMLVYLIADPTEDDIAAKSWEFVKDLVGRNIRIIFGTDLPAGVYGSRELCSSESDLAQIESQIACAGTAKEAGSGALFRDFLKHTGRKSTVLVLCSKMHPNQQSQLKGAEVQVVELQ